MLTGVFSGLATPVRALAVSLAGVLLSWLWFQQRAQVAVMGALVLLVVALLLTVAGDLLLPHSPTAGVRLLEGWILLPTLAAAIGAAIVIVVTVELTLPDTTPTDTKELVGALSTGITSFITAVVLSWASDEDDSRLSVYIRSRFFAHFKQGATHGRAADGHWYFTGDSAGERWV